MNFSSRPAAGVSAMSIEILGEGLDAVRPCTIPATDHPLAKAAAAMLAQCPYREVRAICCEYRNDQLVLSGDVSTYHLKQVAQSIASVVPGVHGITNCIDVRS